jgi:hypothetical protein
VTDIEVLTRELGLRHEVLERLLHELDRQNCAQAILDAQGKRLLWNRGDDVWQKVREAVPMLAENWPQNYPEGRVSGCWSEAPAISDVFSSARLTTPPPTTAVRRRLSTARPDVSFPWHPVRDHVKLLFEQFPLSPVPRTFAGILSFVT